MSLTSRKTLILALLSSVCLLAAACSKDDEAGAKAAGTAMGYLPKSAKFVLGVNIAKARSSKYYKEYKPMLDKELASDSDYKKFQDTCKLDVLGKLEQITVAMEKQNDEDSMFVVIKGLKRSEVADCIGKLKKAGEKVEAKDEGELTAYTVDGGTGYVWWPADDTAVTGPAAEDKPDALKALKKGGKLSDNSDLMAMVKKTNTGAMFWMAGGIPEGLPMGAGAMPGGKPEGIFISANLPGSLDAKLGMTYKDEATAKKAHEGMKKALEDAKSGMAGAFLKEVTVKHSGKDVKVSVNLDEDTVDMIKGMVGSSLPF